MSVKHAFQSNIPDEGTSGKVSPSNWNADHVIDDGTISAAKLTTTAQQFLVPQGGIIMWSGTVASISSLTGWHLCDGTNGTPNLLDRFIVGAGGSYAKGDSGGAAINNLNASQNGPHTHTQNAHTHPHPWGQAYAGNANNGQQTAAQGNNAYRIDHLLSETGSATATNNDSGSGANIENRPPYYALAYIMKL